MNSEDWKLWSEITFKTQGYLVNFDKLIQDENIIAKYDGTITQKDLTSRLPPNQIGEFNMSVWNTELGVKLGIDLKKLVNEHEYEDTYLEVRKLIKDNVLDLTKYKKVVFVHQFIISSVYRKHEILNEFVEMLYRNYHDKDTLIIFLVKPVQDNMIDSYYYQHESVVHIGLTSDRKTISGDVYYELPKLVAKKDKESNKLKLFTVASNCGLRRIVDSNLFYFKPKKTISRIKEKIAYKKTL